MINHSLYIDLKRRIRLSAPFFYVFSKLLKKDALCNLVMGQDLALCLQN